MGDNNTINENSDGNIHNLVDNQSIDIVENNQSDEPDNTVDTGRNPDGTWKKGFCPNPGGRSKKPMKEFVLKEFNEMSDEEKREWLKDVPKELKWRMGEGNPHQDNNTDLQGEIILKISKEISDKYEINTNTGNSSQEPETI